LFCLSCSKTPEHRRERFFREDQLQARNKRIKRTLSIPQPGRRVINLFCPVSGLTKPAVLHRHIVTDLIPPDGERHVRPQEPRREGQPHAIYFAVVLGIRLERDLPQRRVDHTKPANEQTALRIEIQPFPSSGLDDESFAATYLLRAPRLHSVKMPQEPQA